MWPNRARSRRTVQNLCTKRIRRMAYDECFETMSKIEFLLSVSCDGFQTQHEFTWSFFKSRTIYVRTSSKDYLKWPWSQIELYAVNSLFFSCDIIHNLVARFYRIGFLMRFQNRDSKFYYRATKRFLKNLRNPFLYFQCSLILSRFRVLAEPARGFLRQDQPMSWATQCSSLWYG